MADEPSDFLCDPVLIDCGVSHGFGQRGSQPPESTWFPRQVHGIAVATAGSWGDSEPPAADAILSAARAPSVGIVTADCVPILLATSDGSRVAAIHAGWRGLAAGVIEVGLAAFRKATGATEWVCAIGPAARGCCYEVDEPVRAALGDRYAGDLEEPVLTPGRPHRYQLDLPLLATRILEANGSNAGRIGVRNRLCTVCDAARFESYRRDGAKAGRLQHFIAAADRISRQG